MIWKVLLAVLVLFFGALLWGQHLKNDPEWMEKQRAKTAIELCREDEQKYAGNASALAIASPVCRKFEKDYQEKYGSRP